MPTPKAEVRISAKDEFSAIFDKLNRHLGLTDRTVGSLKSTLAGLAAGATLAGFAGMIKGAIDAADALGKLSQRTGVSVEDLDGLKYAADLSGVSLETLGKGMKALSISAVEAASGNKEMSKVFKLMGVDVKDAAGNVKNMNSLLEEAADKFASYRDGPEKAALATKIMSKAGSEMIPLLNMGGEAIRKLREEQARYGGVSTETAKQAEEFNDTITKLQMMSGAFWRELAAGLLPTLNGLAKAMADARSEGRLFEQFINPIVTIFKGLSILAVNVAYVFNAVGREIGGIAAQIGALMTLDFSRFSAIGAEMRAEAEENRKAIDALTKAIWDGVAASNEAAKSGPTRNAPNVGSGNLGDAFSRAESAALQAWSVALGETENRLTDLTQAEKDLLKLEQSSDWKTFTQIQRDRLTAILQLTAGQQKYNKEFEDTQKMELAAERKRAELRDDDAYGDGSLRDFFQRRDVEQEINEEIRRRIELFRSHETDVEKVLLTRRRELEIEAALRNNDVGRANILRERLDLELDLIDITEEQARVKRESEAADRQIMEALRAQKDAALDFARTLSDGIMNAFESGKDVARSFKDTLINLFKSTILRPSIEFLVKGALGGLGFSFPGAASAGGFGGIFGGAPSMGGDGGFGLVSGIGSLFSGGAGAGLSAMFATGAGNAALGLGLSGSTALGIAGIAGTVGMAIPYIGIALMAAQALGLFDRGGPKVGAFAQTSGLNLDPFFSGGDHRQLQQLVTGTQASYRNLVSGFGGRPGDFQFALGYDTDPEGDAPNRISAGASVDGVNVVQRLSEDIGRDQATLEQAIADTVGDALLGALLASDIPEAVKGLLRGFEGTTEELEAYAGKLVGVNALLRTTNVGLQQILSGLTLSQFEDFTDLLGGVGPAVQGLSFYMENFYTEVERATIATESLVGDFANLGLTLPATRLEFRQLMEGIDLTTEAGQRLYASLIGNVQAIDAYYDRIETGTEALAEAAEIFRDNATALAYEDYWTEYRRLAEERRQLAEDEARNRAEARAQLRDWLSELLTGSLSPLAPEQQLGIAKDQYLAALQSGEDIQGAAGRYLEIARQFNPLAYNGAFVDVVNQVGARATPSGMPAPDGFGGVTEMLARVRATTEAGADEVATAVRESATLIINTLTGPRTVVFR